MPTPLQSAHLAIGSTIELPLDAAADYPGAVALLRRDGCVAAIGGAACEIVEGLLDLGAWPGVVAAARRAISAQAAIVEIIGPTGAAEPVEATLLPLAGGAGALALLRPLAFESALRATLVESRQRYKDLVELFADFAWETDRDGRFRFVSPSGALDWPVKAMIGCKVADFLLDADPGAVGFAAAAPIRDAEAWFRRADGGSECLAISAMPMRDGGGLLLGARGICRIVTDERRRADEAAEGRLRDRLVVHLTRSIRDEIDPEQALASAVSATGLALAAAGAVVLRAGPAGLSRAAHWGAAAPPGLLEATGALAATGPLDLVCDGFHVIGGATGFQGQRNGAVVLWRGADQGAFGDEDRAALGDAAAAFGAAIAQLVSHEVALALSRTDALTGLLNRRGFFDEAARRVNRLARSAEPACLLYIDLDNFKLVNDTRGHQAGDDALREVAKLLHDNSRSGDLIARLGGDEFVMWLDGATAATAERRAGAILAASTVFAGLSGSSARPFGVSIGLAVRDPDGAEGPDELLARADAAMYHAKRGGGGAVSRGAPEPVAMRAAP